MKKIITLFIILGLISCGKEKGDKTVCETPIDTPVSDIIWQAPILSDTTLSFVRAPVIHDLSVIIDATPVIGNDDVFYNSINIEDGTSHWISNDHNKTNYSGTEKTINSPYLVSHHYGYVEANNLSDGSLAWHTHIDWGEPMSTSYKDNYYISSENNSFFEQTKAFMYQVDMSNGAKRKIFEVLQEGDWRPSINGRTSGREATNGDEIIYFCANYLNEPLSYISQSDFFAFNLTADTLLYKVRLEYEGDGDYSHEFPTVFSPVVYQDYVYVATPHFIICYDNMTGDEIWRNEYKDGQHTGSELAIKDDILVFKNGHGRLRGLNTNTGNLLWERDQIGDSNGYFSFYENKIIFSGDKLYVLNFHTGQTVKTYTSPMRDQLTSAYYNSFSSVAVDQESGLMFPNDNYFLYCIKIPD